jgi:hypothetical protein
VVGILITRRKTLLHQNSRFERNTSQDFFRDLEPWRWRQQARRDWKGAKRGERDKFRNPDQRCKTRKMFPFNPRERQNLAWLWHLFRKFQ